MSKKLLHENKELRLKALAVINSEWWDQYIALAKSEILSSSRLTPELQAGINLMDETLKTLPDAMTPEDDVPTFNTGLTHHLDSPEDELNQSQPTEKEKA